MSLIKTNKVVFAFVGLAVAVAMMAIAVAPAQAQTAEELQAQISALLAQIESLQGQTGTASGTGIPAGFQFTSDLTLGSTGQSVMYLQKFLNSNGHMVASTGPGSPGNESSYFGQLTRSALASYQSAQGIAPAVGYFGPISRANINAKLASATPPSQTPPVAGLPAGCTTTSGFSPTTGESCAGVGLPAGCTSTAGYSPTTGKKCDSTGSGTGSAELSGDGSITISTSALVSSGTAVKKGETKNVLSTRLKANSGAVKVDRVEVKFNERPWLTMNQVQLRDGSGNVLATKALSGPSDVTEVTVGSDYRVRFENVNLVVNPGTDVDLVVAVSVLSSSDKITGQTITTSIPASGIRTINGIGFSETIGPSATFTFSLPTTGSTADIYTTISPDSPIAGFVSVAAGTTQTENVVLGKYRIKAQNTSGTLESVNFTLQTSGKGVDTLYSNVRLQSGSFNYGASTLASTTEFTNLEVPLPVDQWVDFTLTANVAGADVSGGYSASSTLDASTISGIDTNFNSLTVSNAVDVTSSDLTFLQAGLGASSGSATATNCVNRGDAPADPHCTATFKVTLTNTGNTDVFVSKTPGIALATTSTFSSSTITNVTANPAAGQVAGDTSSSFFITPGASRTFTFTGALKGGAGSSSASTMTVTGIKFGSTNAANTANTLTSGIGDMTITQVL